MTNVNLYKKNLEIEQPSALGMAIQQLIETKMNFERWGFKISFKDFSKHSSQTLLYKSQYCILKIVFSRGRAPRFDELYFSYGRLHARYDEAYINWNGEMCRCWHRRYDHLRFLDGLSPKEAFEQEMMKEHSPYIIKKFRESNLGKKLREKYNVEYVIGKENAIWNHYSQKLFDLFDLKQPEQWLRYRAFLKEYYELSGKKALYGPPYENVC